VVFGLLTDTDGIPLSFEVHPGNTFEKDGFFGIITNLTNNSAKDIVLNYKQLWKIEGAFGELKGSLRSRPVLHWTDHRIIGHLMICFLSYLCEATMTKALREQHDRLESKAIEGQSIKTRPLTVAMVMEELNNVLTIPVNIKSHTIWVRTDIPVNAQNLLKVMNMRIPPKIL